MVVRVLSAERLFERLQKLELHESNLRVGLERTELKPDIRKRFLLLFDRILEEMSRLIRALAELNGGTIGRS
jgi:hypothetical protein